MFLVNLLFNYFNDSKIMIILMCFCRGGGFYIEVVGFDEGFLCIYF